MAISLSDRFWQKVIKAPGDECWKWSGSRHPFGYGMIQQGGGAKGKITASRASWLIHFGKIPDGMYICHKCDNPECTNPDHLFMGTAQDNANDKEDKGRGIRRMSAEANDAIATLAHAGVAKRLIARAFKIDRNLIATAMKHGTINLPPPHVPKSPRLPPSPPPIGVGEKNGNSKITADDVLKIRALREQGQSTAEIANQFAIGKSMVSHICTRRCWTHI